MSKYINELCEGCGLPLNENDDIVVCPKCATPQHRECYKKNNCCVNSHKHSEDFEWKPKNAAPTFKTQSDKAPCPVCGFENKRNSPFCHRCGERLGGEAPTTSSPTEQASNIFDGAFPSSEELLSESDRFQIERVLNERARSAAPGMTPEQEKEQIAGHPIKKVMTLIANHALVYINKFRSIEHGKKLTWNWAAFFFSPFWFFYRRLYKTGIIFLTIRTCISILLTQPLSNVAAAYSSLTADSISSMTEEAYLAFINQLMPQMIPIYIGVAAMLLLSIVSGFIADRLYRKKVKSILDDASNSRCRDEFLIKFLKGSSVNPIAVAIAYTVSVFLPNIIASLFNLI